MITYYITFALVALFCGLAYKNDYAFPYAMPCDRRVHHTPKACFFFALAVIVLVFVAGFRYRVGTDFGAYYGESPLWSEVWNRIVTLDEPGYFFLACVSSHIIHNPVASTLMASAVTIVVAMVTLYRNTDDLLLVGMFYAITSWDGCFNGVRQFLAMSFMFAGYSCLRDRKFAKYLIWVLVAFLFHRSAIVMLIPYFIVKRDVSWKNILVLAIGTVIVLYSYQFLFNAAGWILNGDSTEVADDAYANTTVNILRVLAAVVPTVFFVLTNINRRRSEHTNFCLHLLVINACVCIVTMNSAYLYRITMYTGMFKLIAMPELLKLYAKDDRKVLTWLMIILFAVMWWYEASHSGSLNNFQFIWNK